MAESPIRTFAALPLSLSLRNRLASLQRRLAPLVPPHSVRWIPPHNIHITLFFIGDMLPQRLPGVRSALASVAAALSPVSFQVSGLGVFPDIQRPRIVWVGIKQAGQLTLLHRAVNEALATAGFIPEKRPFAPHLTIARVGRRVNAETAYELGKTVSNPKHDPGVLGIETVETIVLYRSTLKATGAEYEVLNEFKLSDTAIRTD